MQKKSFGMPSHIQVYYGYHTRGNIHHYEVFAVGSRVPPETIESEMGRLIGTKAFAVGRIGEHKLPDWAAEIIKQREEMQLENGEPKYWGALLFKVVKNKAVFSGFVESPGIQLAKNPRSIEQALKTFSQPHIVAQFPLFQCLQHLKEKGITHVSLSQNRNTEPFAVEKWKQLGFGRKEEIPIEMVVTKMLLALPTRTPRRPRR